MNLTKAEDSIFAAFVRSCLASNEMPRLPDLQLTLAAHHSRHKQLSHQRGSLRFPLLFHIDQAHIMGGARDNTFHRGLFEAETFSCYIIGANENLGLAGFV